METTSTYGPGQVTADPSESTMEQARNQAQEMTQQAKEKASNLVDQARTRVKTRVTEQKDRAAENLTSVADRIRTTGHQIDDQVEEIPVGRYADRAAETVENLAAYLRTHEVDDMVAEVEDYARRNPAVFIGTAFALGFMASRFLKSSTSESGADGRRGRYRSTQEYGYGRSDTPFYRDRETILEAERHERQGYSGEGRFASAGELDARRTAPPQAAAGTYGGGYSAGEGATPGVTDMEDEDMTSDYAETTRVRSSDV